MGSALCEADFVLKWRVLFGFVRMRRDIIIIIGNRSIEKNPNHQVFLPYHASYPVSYRT